MTREEALKLVNEKVSNKNLRKHMFATESVMKHLAQNFNEDEELWSLAGLLHDLDYDQTADDFPRHGLITADMLAETDVPEDRRIQYRIGINLPLKAIRDISPEKADWIRLSMLSILLPVLL